MTRADVLGRPLKPEEERLMDLYAEVKALLSEPDNLPPAVVANLRVALAALWQITHDLDLQFEQLYDPYGV